MIGSVDLAGLHGAALASDNRADWQRFWQVLAGTSLVVPLEDGTGDRVRPQMVVTGPATAVQAFTSMESFADHLSEPGDYAEIDGAHLAEMLAPQGTALSISLGSDRPPVLIDAETLGWIANTFRAEVSRAEGAGVSVSAPDLPEPELIAAIGQTIGALGADCPEAWLVTLTDRDGAGELALVLGLADRVRAMEAEIAETVTRAIQAIADRPIAVACADRGSALMAAARRLGIGIGG